MEAIVSKIWKETIKKGKILEGDSCNNVFSRLKQTCGAVAIKQPGEKTCIKTDYAVKELMGRQSHSGELIGIPVATGNRFLKTFELKKSLG